MKVLQQKLGRESGTKEQLRRRNRHRRLSPGRCAGISQMRNKGVRRVSEPKKLARKTPYQRTTKPSKVEVQKSAKSPTPYGWTHVNSVKNLPPINSVVECNWPGFEHSIKCTILSKAGKASKGNWHYLNIREDGEENAKCVSFENIDWQFIQQNDDKSSVTPITLEILFE